MLLAPEGSRPHDAAKESDIEWHDLSIKKNGLHMLDNLRAVKAACESIPKCDVVLSWTIRTFPASEWLGRQWTVPCAGVLHDNPFPRKMHGPVLWNPRGMDFKRLCSWKEMLWHSQEYVLRTWWRWQWAHRVANRFSKLVCVSEAVRQECIRNGYRCPMTVIRNGLVDIPVGDGIQDGKLRIGFLGMEHPHRKGFSVVEQWISRLTGDVVWKLYGGASKSTVRRIEKLKKQYSIEYRGFQDRTAIFKEIDVLMHASTLFDPLPTVLIEAARAGIPCVASSQGGASEIVEEEVSGSIFDLDETDVGLEKLNALFDCGRRERMGRNARNLFGERFRVERMAQEYLLFFTCLIGGKNT
ncbi:N-acetyl-alpha-D-glucosaminyl L-malate synthase [Pontiella sulfatireligans]|uniref:N-acetyl-alpha-D-glucosaminyl L-malate synthase n=1 Tax=Pontiella sulfatireligans TaxID=2750658 RepID=A0A6C2UFV5_9BACT|nr:N-acetyl-alpha-D-glucosaminyl L-malate synthase [Pontiella sulfatireligans]